jgi:hypothetical protein
MIFFINWLTYRKNLKKNNGISFELKKEVYGELYKLAINPRLLVDGTLFVEFSKEMDSEFVSRSLKYAQRRFEDPT